MTTLEDRPVADLERAAKLALMGLRPEFERRWRWQRWAALVGAFAAGGAVIGLTNAATWAVAAAVTRHEAKAEGDQWSAWWNASCGNKSPNRIVVSGKPVYQLRQVNQRTDRVLSLSGMFRRFLAL